MAKEEGIDYVRCRHCGAEVSKIVVPHLRRCGAEPSVRAYRMKYPEAPLEARVKKRTEEQRQAQSEKLKARFQTAEGEETRRRIAEASKALQAGAYGAAAAEHLRALNADPGNRKEISVRSKQMWATGKVREKQAAWIAEHRGEVEASAASARAHITCWGTEAHREKMVRLLKLRWQDETFRNRMNALTGQRWEGVEFREKMEDLLRERWADPVFRQKMVEFNKRRWQNPAYREKMLDHRSRLVVPFKDSKIEVAMQGILNRIGIPYEKHGILREIGRHQYDMVLHEQRAVLECMGCFWHCCAQCIANPLPLGFKRRERDRLLREATEAAGWRLLEVWEHEFRDLLAVEQRVRAFLGM